MNRVKPMLQAIMFSVLINRIYQNLSVLLKVLIGTICFTEMSVLALIR